MTKNPSTPPPIPRDEWESRIEATDGVIFRYRIYLEKGFLQYGPDAYGWLRITYRGARRKAARELLRKLRSDRRQARRRLQRRRHGAR